MSSFVAEQMLDAYCYIEAEFLAKNREVFVMNKILVFVAVVGLILGVIYVQPTLADFGQGKARNGNVAIGTYRDQALIGLKVQSSGGEDLGRISSLAIDPKDGRVAFGVLTYGGFWGFRAKYVAVPLTVMDLRTDKNGKPDAFVLDMNKQQLAGAPTFDGNSLPDQKQVEESYRFFGQTPYWTEAARHGFDFSIHIGR